MLEPAFPRLTALRERVQSLFYKYGLFCATHQVSTMLFACISVLIVIYPLTNIPFLGNAAQSHETSAHDYKPPTELPEPQYQQPRWYRGNAIGYVQQIVVKSAIIDPHQSSASTNQNVDAYRSLLQTSFNLLKQINNIQIEEGKTRQTIADVCLRVSEPDANLRERNLLPNYDCLVLSPASIWQNQQEVFDGDAELVKTVHSTGHFSYEASPRMREILFGVPWSDTGLSKFFMRKQKRTVNYAVTIVYKSYNETFVRKLTEKLMELYPLSAVLNHNTTNHITHVSYRENSTSYLVEYTPLIAAYFILFLYIYFSVQKIEMVKSKWGLAVAAVVTVVASLLMSISMCAVFGVTPSVNSGEIFPYLVVIVGLENVLVLTRSVVSTPLNLEVKFRIAEGLKKEGWYITKNLITELVILAFGFLTFVPAIQEFCLFASIGLLVDFYLQMVFFATILSIDIRRLELSDLDRGHAYLHVQSDKDSAEGAVRTHSGNIPSTSVKKEGFAVTSLFHIPKRIQVMNFVAQFRIVQRLIMACTVVWIIVVMYKTGIIDSLKTQLTLAIGVVEENAYSPRDMYNLSDTRLDANLRELLSDDRLKASISSIIHHEDEEENWKCLSFMHWPAVFSFYNKSIVGTYVSFLPSIKLSVIVQRPGGTRSDGTDTNTVNNEGAEDYEEEPKEETSSEAFQKWVDAKVSQFRVLSTAEQVVLISVFLLSLIVLTLILRYLYSVMCRKDYAKWRKSAGRNTLQSRLVRYTEILSDESNVYMDGLSQPIECLVCSSNLIVCSDLSGDLQTWNIQTGETISQISRSPLPIDSINADDDFKIHYQTGVEFHHDVMPQCSYNIPATVTTFDLAPFVSTQFNKMEKKSFAECLKEIELERKQQETLMSNIHSPESLHPGSPLIADSHTYALPSGVTLSSARAPNIWCMDVSDGLIIAGCSNGNIEFWDSCNGTLKYRHISTARSSGIASIKAYGNRVIAGRTDGYLDFIEISYIPTANLAANSAAEGHSKGHRRIRSLGNTVITWRETNLQCTTLRSVKAHQSTIGLLTVASGRCLTACEDKIINVYRADDAHLLYTLRGHKDSIILLQADEQTATAQTASEDGMIRLWDLLTGACIHKLTGLIGPILHLSISSNYVVASSLDSLICVWDKSSGRMLHSIHRAGHSSLSGALAILADCLLVSGGRDTLYFWDLECGELVYTITLPTTTCVDSINNLQVINGSTLVAVIGSQIHSILFPKMLDRRVL